VASVFAVAELVAVDEARGTAGGTAVGAMVGAAIGAAVGEVVSPVFLGADGVFADGGISLGRGLCAKACEFIVASAPNIISARAPTRNAVIDLHPYRVAGIRILAVSAAKQHTLDLTQEQKYEAISVGSCALYIERHQPYFVNGNRFHFSLDGCKKTENAYRRSFTSDNNLSPSGIISCRPVPLLAGTVRKVRIFPEYDRVLRICIWLEWTLPIAEPGTDRGARWYGIFRIQGDDGAHPASPSRSAALHHRSRLLAPDPAVQATPTIGIQS
jgi:hypothetical protein